MISRCAGMLMMLIVGIGGIVQVILMGIDRLRR